MADEPIFTKMDNSELTPTSGGSPAAVGCQNVETPRGPVHFCEVPGLMTSELNNPGHPDTVALMIYRSPKCGHEAGHGYLLQLMPKAAREIAASLNKLADRCDAGETDQPLESVITFTGPPITPEMQMIFGAYFTGRKVTGVMPIQTGVQVTYDDGEMRVDFVPVISGGKTQ